MRIAICCFTDRGAGLAERLERALPADVYRPEKESLAALTARLFAQADALVFIGAAGIAVRAIAPHMQNKTQDPAIVVLDERGRYVIPLLSGHIGGANRLAQWLAALTGGEAVLTTATDVNGRFAVDDWATRHRITIGSMTLAKRFAMEALRGEVPLACEFNIKGELPNGIYLGKQGDFGLQISLDRRHPAFCETLWLTPRIVSLGVGCKRGTSCEKIRSAIDAALDEADVDEAALFGLATIDLKKDEAGLAECARALGLPVAYFTAEELKATPGSRASSPFVEATTGVDNVCERAALRLAGAGAALRLEKRARDGVTVALAVQKWSVRFDEADGRGHRPGRSGRTDPAGMGSAEER